MTENKKRNLVEKTALTASTVTGILGAVTCIPAVQVIAYFPAVVEKVILEQCGKKKDIEKTLLQDLKVAISETCKHVHNRLENESRLLADFFHSTSIYIEDDTKFLFTAEDMDVWLRENMQKEIRWGYVDITDKNVDDIIEIFLDEFSKQLLNCEPLNKFLAAKAVISLEKRVDKIEKQIEKIQKQQQEKCEARKQFSNNRISYKEAYKDAIYRSHVYYIVPNKLFQRDDELKLLEEICQNESGYFSFEAEAYAGKSALLSWFFQHPPKNVWIVGYFLISIFFFK